MIRETKKFNNQKNVIETAIYTKITQSIGIFIHRATKFLT